MSIAYLLGYMWMGSTKVIHEHVLLNLLHVNWKKSDTWAFLLLVDFWKNCLSNSSMLFVQVTLRDFAAQCPVKKRFLKLFFMDALEAYQAGVRSVKEVAYTKGVREWMRMQRTRPVHCMFCWWLGLHKESWVVCRFTRSRRQQSGTLTWPRMAADSQTWINSLTCSMESMSSEVCIQCLPKVAHCPHHVTHQCHTRMVFKIPFCFCLTSSLHTCTRSNMFGNKKFWRTQANYLSFGMVWGITQVWQVILSGIAKITAIAAFPSAFMEMKSHALGLVKSGPETYWVFRGAAWFRMLWVGHAKP